MTFYATFRKGTVHFGQYLEVLAPNIEQASQKVNSCFKSIDMVYFPDRFDPDTCQGGRIAVIDFN